MKRKGGEPGLTEVVALAVPDCVDEGLPVLPEVEDWAAVGVTVLS